MSLEYSFKLMSYFTNIFSNIYILKNLSKYNFNLNKWPIDKAPKVSGSSYYLGVSFVLLFHFYLFNAIESFSFISYNFFSIQIQLCTILFCTMLLLFSRTQLSSYLNLFALLFIVFFVVFYLYGTKVSEVRYFRYAYVVQSKLLVINWEFYVFLFFFFSWLFKVYKKYAIESFTKNESLLYKSILPSLVSFELFTFIYLIIWKFVNTTLLGYPTVMYLKYYKYQYLADAVTSKVLAFTLFILLLDIVVRELKRGLRFLAIEYFLVFILILSMFTFLEFRDYWLFVHQTAALNLSKFTYFKFFSFILVFNFAHLAVALFSNYVFLIALFFRDLNYSDFFDLVYLNYKILYFLLALAILLYLSVIVVNDYFIFLF